MLGAILLNQTFTAGLSSLFVVMCSPIVLIVNKFYVLVYNDVKFLERIGFVRLSKEGRGMVPELLVQELTISLG